MLIILLSNKFSDLFNTLEQLINAPTIDNSAISGIINQLQITLSDKTSAMQKLQYSLSTASSVGNFIGGISNVLGDHQPIINILSGTISGVQQVTGLIYGVDSFINGISSAVDMISSSIDVIGNVVDAIDSSIDDIGSI